MHAIERQFILGFTALAAVGVAAGTVVRKTRERERKRLYATHVRADGSPVEIEFFTPPQAKAAVFFENGLGMPHETWSWVCDNLPEDIAYVRYNRPGYGRSAAAENHTIAEGFTLVDELCDTYVPNLPLTMVGHSIGGYLVAAYAASRADTRPFEKLVLVDSTNIDQLHNVRNAGYDQWTRQGLLMERFWAFSGLTAISRSEKRSEYSAAVEASRRGFSTSPGTWLTAYREYRAALAFPPLGKVQVPVDVVTARTALSGTAHDDGQAELLKISDISQHHFLDGADHMRILSDPSHAGQIATLIAWADASHLPEVLEGAS
ncbi:hypothetical protein GCM10010271_67860 [Streptomyces kurssanovii]|nr:hypothetical protein GCM10010271_67860 [Streptomyces kurssanovii]